MVSKVTALVRATALALVIHASAEASEQPVQYTLATFDEAALRARFDSDQDGILDARERETLRKAFGDVDVPMFPARPYVYGGDKTPNYIDDEQLRRMDNTPADNPITNAGARLGRVLFYDRQLSQNDTIACASCHLQEHAFSDPRRVSVGFDGGHTNRNAMGLANLRFTNMPGGNPGFFWDERAATLEDQVLMPIQDPIEMGMDLPALEAKLQSLPYYPPLFLAAFGDPRVTTEGIAKAVAQFMRSMVSFNSKFDRAAESAGTARYSVDFNDFTPEENLGKSLFIDGVGGVAEIGCAHCHILPTFGMTKSLNNGLDLHYSDAGLGARGLPSNEPFTPSNDGKFKAPSLRNIASTSPYMHDGRFGTLEEVIEHYSGGVHPHENVGIAFTDNKSDASRAKNTSGFHLTVTQRAALLAFLETLTDDAFVADPRFSDPFIRSLPQTE